MTQAYNLSQLANNLDSSGRLDATDGLVNAVPVANGGTGASSVAAAVSNLSASIYPIGSIYINAGVTTNPATLLGFGTWTAFGAGRVLVGLNSADSAFDALQETGGSKDAVLVSHTHSANSAGSHQHFSVYNAATDSPSQLTPTVTSNKSLAAVGSSGFEAYVLNGTSQTPDGGLTNSAGSHTHTIDSAGSSATNANLQPYITVCMWLRIS
jgi:hypothetical protein